LTSWGADTYGAVSQTPIGNDFVSIACGAEHSFAIKTDGTIVSWGQDFFQQVTDSPAGSDFVQLAGGWNHSLALRSAASGPIYNISNLIVGMVATVEVSNCPAGSQVVFAYSFAGPGPTSTVYGDVEMSLPINHLGPFPEVAGLASIQVLIPGSLAGNMVHTQSLVLQGGGVSTLTNALHLSVP
jgi:hypothetical protein